MHYHISIYRREISKVWLNELIISVSPIRCIDITTYMQLKSQVWLPLVKHTTVPRQKTVMVRVQLWTWVGHRTVPSTITIWAFVIHFNWPGNMFRDSGRDQARQLQEVEWMLKIPVLADLACMVSMVDILLCCIWRLHQSIWPCCHRQEMHFFRWIKAN